MVQPDRQYVIGLAGHIDHGKTLLVEALTGTNTDRLKEEQERGITVDLGFAHLSHNVTLIDVPGHERLIKNMVAGVSTIDLVLFVVAADDGIMPQTREHFDIVSLLGIQQGIFVITKIDLVEEEWLFLVEEELREFLQDTVFAQSPIIQTSAIKGTGIEEVRQTIEENLRSVKSKRDDNIFRLPVDRTFSLPGFGNIVTGSVLSGNLNVGESVEILPEKLSARVRGLQSHDLDAEQVSAGYRAAINLAGIEHHQLHRGQVITLPGYYKPVTGFNARLTVLKDAKIGIKNQMRLRLHLHTSEVFARVVLPEKDHLKPGESTHIQMKLEEPIYTSYGDRFIIRQYSPQITLGGGTVLETNPPKFRKKHKDLFYRTLSGLESEDSAERIRASFSIIDFEPLTFKELQIKTGVSSAELENILTELKNKNEVFKVVRGKAELFYSKEQLEAVLNLVDEILGKYHKQYPGRAGMGKQELQSRFVKRFSEPLVKLAVWYGVNIDRLKSEDESISLRDFSPQLSEKQQEKLNQIEQLYRASEFNPPDSDQVLQELGISESEFMEFITILREQNKIVPVSDKLYFHANTIDNAIRLLKNYFAENEDISVSHFKDIINTTRKYALPLLTYLDNQKYTVREGDVRVPGPALKS